MFVCVGVMGEGVQNYIVSYLINEPSKAISKQEKMTLNISQDYPTWFATDAPMLRTCMANYVCVDKNCFRATERTQIVE